MTVRSLCSKNAVITPIGKRKGARDARPYEPNGNRTRCFWRIHFYLRTVDNTMRGGFKHVRNYLSNLINIVLLWILQYIWTLPGFVVVISYLYSNESIRHVQHCLPLYHPVDCRSCD